MSQATELIARQMASGANIGKIWGNLIYYVKDAAYGAKGDGETDDTAEIQAAVNAAGAAGGGIVFLTKGTFLVSSTLLIPSNVIVRGIGKASVIKLADTIETPILKNADDTNGNTFIVVEDLTLDGNPSGHSSTYDIPVLYMVRSENIYINRVWITGSKGSGIWTTGCSYVHISSCITANNSGGSGISLRFLDGEPCTGYTITDCVVYSNLVGIQAIGEVSDVIISGCFSYDNNSILGDGSGIELTTSPIIPAPLAPQRVTIENCICYRNIQNIRVEGEVSDVTITGCIAYLATFNGFFVYSSSFVSIINCASISNGSSGFSIERSGTDGIVPNYIRISNCFSHNNVGYGYSTDGDCGTIWFLDNHALANTAGDYSIAENTAQIRKSYVIGARVYNNADQAIPTGADTALVFNSESFDSDTIHDTLTNNSRLTCKTQGIYEIKGQVEIESNATGVRNLYIRLNGAVIIGRSQVTPNTGSTTFMNVSTQWELNINDYVDLVLVQTSGVSLNALFSGVSSPSFSMVKNSS